MLAPRSEPEGSTSVSSESGRAAAIKGVPSSRQKLSVSSSKVRLQVGQRFIRASPLKGHLLIGHRNHKQNIDDEPNAINQDRQTTRYDSSHSLLPSANHIRVLLDL